MIAIRYRVHLEEPVLVTSLQGDPNSAVAFDYLPGSVLRGALIGRVLKQPVIHDEVTRRRFFENSTRFLNAYPVLNDQRMLPTPSSWIKQGNLVADDLLGAKTDASIKRKRVQEMFHQRDEDRVWLHTPDHHIAIHIERSRTGVPQGDEGEVYRYDSLAEGAAYEGVIVCDEKADADYFEGQFKKSFTLWIGGARTAGYGRTSWKLIARDNEWLEHRHHQPDGQQWVIAFLSPALLRDTNGQYAADEAAILQHLRISNAAAKSVIDSEMIGGFNRKWGLPLPQSLAVSAGSVIAVNLPMEFNAAALEHDGIGERRIDGFGRIAVYRQKTDTFTIQPEPNNEGREEQDEAFKTQFKKETTSAILNTADQTTVSVIKDRIQRERQRYTIEERANMDRFKIKKAPRHTQLSALREAVAAGIRHTPASVQPVLMFLTSTDDRYFSRTQFEEARVNGYSLTAWVRGVLNGTLEQDITRDGDKTDIKSALRLIDAVVARAVRTVEKSKR